MFRAAVLTEEMAAMAAMSSSVPWLGQTTWPASPTANTGEHHAAERARGITVTAAAAAIL
jgi:hypothetical protein